MKIFNNALDAMFNVEKYLDKKTDNLVETLKWITMVSLIPAVILAIVTYFGYNDVVRTIALPPLGLDVGMAAATVFLGTVIGSILFLVIGAVVLYVFAMLLGGKGAYNDNLSALAASLNPVLLLGWIPFINIIAMVFSPTVLVYGLAKKNKLPIFKAAVAIAIPSILLALVAAYVAFTVPSIVMSFIPGLVSI